MRSNLISKENKEEDDGKTKKRSNTSTSNLDMQCKYQKLHSTTYTKLVLPKYILLMNQLAYLVIVVKILRH